jgi:ubiquinone/menaquinone biosynthesis C-methylase UbiE
VSSSEIEQWWAEHPMTYATTHGGTVYEGESFERGTPEFFKRLDREFLAWNEPLHGDRPFSRLFPYDEFGSNPSVLEIGCGLGTMASGWARGGASVTAVDLNDVAVETTRRRFELDGLEGRILKADARALPFDDAAFDYVWSWGVLHHSPEIDRSFAELMRVLRPGGGFGVMVYNRHSLLHRYATEYLEGFLHLERRFLDELQLASRYGDAAAEEGNAYTWPMTQGELRDALAPYSSDLAIRVLGTDLDHILSLMIPGLARVVPRTLKKPWARRFGWSLWASGHRS